jgi:hypothetical protein
MNYQASGEMYLGGCAGVLFKKRYFVRFVVGSRLYVKRKAIAGELEKVVIKRVNQVFPRDYEGMAMPETNYVDVFNRVWMEDELVTQQDGVDLARIFWENIRQEGRNGLKSGSCLPIPPEGCGRSS